MHFLPADVRVRLPALRIQRGRVLILLGGDALPQPFRGGFLALRHNCDRPLARQRPISGHRLACCLHLGIGKVRRLQGHQSFVFVQDARADPVSLHNRSHRHTRVSIRENRKFVCSIKATAMNVLCKSWQRTPEVRVGKDCKLLKKHCW
jgi:hypothetical protein